ncbi:MAG TPA: hypothetical protein VH231_15055 [Solirubrobacteraceae bacterium]|nr:hypothetical protein [Solirubrobacteraceae bacterium]
MRSLGVAVALLLVLAAPAAAAPRWLRGAHIVVSGDLDNQDCRTGVCKHNEKTDLIEWNDAIWFVHRTAGSQILGPNSSLRVYRSRDHGRHFALQAIVPAPVDRDIRDPSCFVAGKRLRIKAITRLPGFALRDADGARCRSRPASRTVGIGRRCARSGRRAGASGASRSSAASTTPPPTEAHSALRAARELRGWAALDPRVGRAAQRRRHVLRRRGAARRLALPRDLVLDSHTAEALRQHTPA